MANLPKLKDLYTDLSVVQKNDELVTLLNNDPPKEWIKVHPYISGHKYIPIERIEFLLKSIFKQYRIEITGQGIAFNGVYVTVRVHYVHPVTGEWQWHDGIGAAQLQTQKGSSPAELQNINNGALSMAFPIAKTLAVKDACDHFGKLFGSDINRKDVVKYENDLTLKPLDESHPSWVRACDAVKNGAVSIEQIKEKYTLTKESEEYLWKLISK